MRKFRNFSDSTCNIIKNKLKPIGLHRKENEKKLIVKVDFRAGHELLLLSLNALTNHVAFYQSLVLLYFNRYSYVQLENISKFSCHLYRISSILCNKKIWLNSFELTHIYLHLSLDWVVLICLCIFYNLFETVSTHSIAMYCFNS